MKKIDELHTILELIKKHDLPLSPILEYAIKEKEDQYMNEYALDKKATAVAEPQPKSAAYKELDDYVQEFANLSVGSSRGKKLPHKAVLLLGIMRLIENGQLADNKLPLEKIILNSFDLTWKIYFNNVKVPSVWTPFWYMKSETFWHFKAVEGHEDLLHTMTSLNGLISVGKMRPVIKYAYFDDALFSFIQNVESKEKLEKVLLETYIKQ